MLCPFCLHGKTKVYNSRQTSRLNLVWRRRYCVFCKKEFTTNEHVLANNVLCIRGGKKFVTYSRLKLIMSISRACDHHDNNDETIYWLTDTVEQKLYAISATNNNSITVNDIMETTLNVLKNFDTTAYVKYLTRHIPKLDTKSLKDYLRR